MGQSDKASAGNSSPVTQSAPKVGVLGPLDLKDIIPATVFFRGQTASVQTRNSGGVRTSEGMLFMTGLVDSSGYSSGVADKYQAYLITEVSVTFDGKSLGPGAYGCGFSDSGQFNVMDLGAHDILTTPSHIDSNLRRPVPLKIAETAGAYRLYFGRRYVDFKFAD
jgi:hypothetical protein